MKIKHFFLLLFFWINLCAVAQRTITPTDSLRIFGEVKNPITFSLAELDTFPESAINDQIIYNHNGEVKDTLTGMIGIPLKTLLGSIEYTS
ncbi:MAG: hypothetical protein IPO32_14370 [Crocinitomicaceae bacterium]|nr:hypothetical protein [Crocinitomicaceae bacterium]